VEPIPETAEAVDEFGPFTGTDADTLVQLRAMGERVRALVPELVGLSLAMLDDGVTLTLVASDDEIAALDGVQYLFDGPCVSAVEADRTLEYRSSDPLDEELWQFFARATAEAGIASTLSLLVLEDHQVVGSVNLYAATPDAFTGLHEPVAEVLGAWAPGAVTNADLDFTTRRTAERAPQILREELRIQVAVGIIIASDGVDPETARTRLRDAADRAGVSESALAEVVIGQLGRADEPPAR
jgi:hypothetical protein